MRTLFSFSACLVIMASSAAQAQDATSPKTVEFKSQDDLKVTADLYQTHEDAETPFIVLCHQAGWSRGEYRQIAPRLNELGFNCLAIDQRSGGAVNDVKNETLAAAKKAGADTGFVSAEQDMVAAVNFVKESGLAEGKVVLWGSSYSAALALRITGENPGLVDGVLSFAPGEYFRRFGKPGDWIANSAEKIEVPAFITSAKNEYRNWSAIFEAIPGDSKAKFVPETAGNHGSRALWQEFDDNTAYWESVEKFLEQFATTKDD